MIEVPSKIWIPKQEKNTEYHITAMILIMEYFDYKLYGKSLFKRNLSWKPIKRYDVIVFDVNLH